MARRPRVDEERSMDSLMDAMTNVVGILLLILIVSSLGITAAVQKIVENIPEVSVEELEQMKVLRKTALDDLQSLKQTHIDTTSNQMKPEEASQLKLELDDFEKNNQDLAAKTSDIAEWRKKVEEEKELKVVNDEKVVVASDRDRELAAILAQTPEAVVAKAKEIKMPNPRFATEQMHAVYLLCKNEKLYFIGDPYENALKIRDVIDQNFKTLAYTDTTKPGSYTYAIKGTKQNDARNGFLPLDETFRLTRAAEKDLAAWDKISLKWWSGSGPAADRSVLRRIFGNEDKKDLQVHKFRYDLKKVEAFFKGKKLGPTDYYYQVFKGGSDRVKFGVSPREEAGWKPEEFLAGGSKFDAECKRYSNDRNAVFYFYVAADSFETYLSAREKTEFHGIQAGWNVWPAPSEMQLLQAVPIVTTTDIELPRLPVADYMALANKVGPYMAQEMNKEWAGFESAVNGAKIPPEIAAKPAEKAAFLARLRAERLSFNTRTFQSNVINIFRAGLASQEVSSGRKTVQMEIHPPEIPHIRVFVGAAPPEAPKPVVVKDTKIGVQKKGGNQAAGGNSLILD